jgi:hypothetical protein
MDCERVRDLLSDFHDGTLGEEERLRVDFHLRQCPACTTEAEGLKETVALLRGLSPGKAPPELLGGVLARIAAAEPAETPLWKKLFLPAHVKIPLEAAAAILLFFLVYGLPKEKAPEATAPSPHAAQTETAPSRENAFSLPGSIPRPGERRTEPARRMDFPIREARKEAPKDAGQAIPTADAPSAPLREPAERPGGGVAIPGPAKPRGTAGGAPQSPLPSVPAQRASTAAERIDPGLPAGSKTADEPADLRVFGAPPSRLLRPLPFGRDVTVEVSPENRLGLEERVAAAAIRLGGSVRLTPEPAATPPEGEASGKGVVRVHLPAASAESFLDGLRSMGTLFPEKGPAVTDLPLGPADGVVAYTVRIRVR